MIGLFHLSDERTRSVPSPDPPPPDMLARKPDAVRTQQDILDVARAEFVAHGLSGARVDAIAARTRTTKRMLYYYFGSKQGLYLAVLEQAYREILEREPGLDLASLSPAEALRRIVEFTFDHHESHPDFVRLVCIENIHRGQHLAQADAVRGRNVTAIETLRRVLDRGQRAGLFRDGLDPVDIHMMISAFCFYRVANQHTFGTLFGAAYVGPESRARHRRMIGDAVLALVSR